MGWRVDEGLLVDPRQQWVSKHKRGVPPFGHSTHLRVFVDSDLLQYDEVWAVAGTWSDNFGAAPSDIVRVAGGVVTDLKRAWCRSVNSRYVCRHLSIDEIN